MCAHASERIANVKKFLWTFLLHASIYIGKGVIAVFNFHWNWFEFQIKIKINQQTIAFWINILLPLAIAVSHIHRKHIFGLYLIKFSDLHLYGKFNALNSLSLSDRADEMLDVVRFDWNIANFFLSLFFSWIAKDTVFIKCIISP